ncbi:hypothetical protein ACTG9Q_28875 [Actinokineospora sp. 24-640]
MEQLGQAPHLHETVPADELDYARAARGEGELIRFALRSHLIPDL